MRKLLLTGLLPVLACGSTEPVVSGSYEGEMRGTGADGRQATGTLKMTLEQDGDRLDGTGEISAVVFAGRGGLKSWEAVIALSGTVGEGDQPELTMDVDSGCGESRLSGRKEGLSILLFGETWPKDKDCLPLPGPIHLFARLEPAE